MSIKKNLFVLTLCAAFCLPVFASTNFNAEPTKTVTKEIKTLIEKLNFDFEKFDDQTVRVKFMVNEAGELIVISTNDSKLDKTLKGALNYKKIDASELIPYNPYIVPIKFDLDQA